MSQKLTPMMQQYFGDKRGLLANTLLLFRLGDFYEMFFEDEEIGSRLLGITLTKRQDTPMCGSPHQATSLPGTIPTTHGVSPDGCDAVPERLLFSPAAYRRHGNRYAAVMQPLLGFASAGAK